MSSLVDTRPMKANTMHMGVTGWLLCLVTAYLYGSVSFAIIVTRLVTGTDIRTQGNRNAGAANVSRMLGGGWGALVLILDISKGILPILLLRSLVLPAAGDAGPIASTAAELSVGVAAIIGHCRPLYYRFRGGRGIATAIGVYVMLVPIEAIVALFAAAGIVAVALRNVEHRIGPYTPVVFVVLAPILATITALWVDVPIVTGLSIGAHSWHRVAAVFLLSLTIVALNPAYLTKRVNDLRTGTDPTKPEEHTGPGRGNR